MAEYLMRGSWDLIGVISSYSCLGIYCLSHSYIYTLVTAAFLIAIKPEE